MLYDKKMPSLKDKIQEEMDKVEKEEKNEEKKLRGVSRASVKKTKKKSK